MKLRAVENKHQAIVEPGTSGVIRPALPGEADLLTNIAVEAKRYWGYSTRQLQDWRKSFLRVSPEYVLANNVWLATVGNEGIAFAALRREPRHFVLDHLWVLPDYIGRGIGRQLFVHVTRWVGSVCRCDILFTSDPNADGFYNKMGAQKVGSIYSAYQEVLLSRFSYQI